MNQVLIKKVLVVEIPYRNVKMPQDQIDNTAVVVSNRINIMRASLEASLRRITEIPDLILKIEKGE